ncbi:MAG: hypothetical protein IPM29_21045 [Planctomycetes bacterium]|nr:hypothetical protein [Planctomycetota bacterium]
MFDFLLPILLFMVPVLAVVLLATAFGRRLRGSCGGVGSDGSCTRCGKPAVERDAEAATGQGACSSR